MKRRVGDIVTIRDWDDMKKEFGLNQLGEIKCDFTFIRPMRDYCGKKLKIENMGEETYYLSYNGEFSSFIFGEDMFVKKSINYDELVEIEE